MRRREFISLLTSACASASLPARAQLPTKTVVALVFGAMAQTEVTGSLPARAFVDELRELGWVEGHTISIEQRTL